MTMFQKEIVNNAVRTYVYDIEGNKKTLASLETVDKDFFNEITFYENYMPQLDSNTNILIPSNMYISGAYNEDDEWVDLNAYPVVYAYKDGTPVWA